MTKEEEEHKSEDEEEEHENEEEDESDEWCECSFCGDEITEEKSEMVGDYCVCYDCYLKSVKKVI